MTSFTPCAMGGRRIEVLSRDDAGQPQTAAQLAGELLSDARLALSDFAARNNKLYVAGEPLTDAPVWKHGTPTSFRRSARSTPPWCSRRRRTSCRMW